ncbi:hypothetical protein B0T25DRAFT_569068 [Lasiosphaeria hispida]|uniref:Ankyrin repeat protein n=1 Tax=Lasiosphaeria hispida TaxID=260671 RepID=A0AAJ0HJI9_9PEZI|nr:hypothetical protein B0T25DRAFT_569068 [Lasiosphaeria hispida]
MAKQNGQFSTTRWMQEIKKHTQDTSPTSRFSCEYQHGRRDRADSPSRGCKDSDRSQEYFNFVDLLLANRADIDAGDNQKLTPLRVVIWGGDTGGEAKRQLEVAEYLLEREAQTPTADQLEPVGDIPLHDAALRADEDLIELLLDYKANAEVKNMVGKVPSDALSSGNPGTQGAYKKITKPRIKSAEVQVLIPVDAPHCEEDNKRQVCEDFYATVRFHRRSDGLSWAKTVLSIA